MYRLSGKYRVSKVSLSLPCLRLESSWLLSFDRLVGKYRFHGFTGGQSSEARGSETRQRSLYFRDTILSRETIRTREIPAGSQLLVYTAGHPPPAQGVPISPDIGDYRMFSSHPLLTRLSARVLSGTAVPSNKDTCTKVIYCQGIVKA